MSDDAAIRCRFDLTYSYSGAATITAPGEIAARPGELVGLTGEADCGKSTLLRLLGGILEPTTGVIERCGEVGWLVPAVEVTNPVVVFENGGTQAKLRPTTEPPPIVLADEPISGIAHPRNVDGFFDLLCELCDRGAAMVIADHMTDMLDLCDHVYDLTEHSGTDRGEFLRQHQRTYGTRWSQQEPSIDALQRRIDDTGALPVIDPDHGVYVILPRLDFNNRQFVKAASWFIVDTPTYRTMLRRRERQQTRTQGPRDSTGRRLLDYEPTDTPQAARVRFGGDAAAATDPTDWWAWWPGKGGAQAAAQLQETLGVDPEETWAISTAYVPPHPLALDDSMCDALIALGGDLPPNSDTARPFERVLDEDEITPAVLQRLSLAIEAANAAWWGFDIDRWTLHLKRYEPEQAHAHHVDLVPAAAGRKLSASVQLSDGDSYTGGDVVIRYPGLGEKRAPRERGSIIVFPPWTPHEVGSITEGERWSLVIWGYGARFR